MRAFRIAFSLLCIPRLFASLVLFPVILSLIIVVFEVLVTGVLLRTTRGSARDIEDTYKQIKSTSIGRAIIYGKSEPLSPLIVCRWVVSRNRDGVMVEEPPKPECYPDRLDVALQVPNPQVFDSTEYEKIFNGTIERLHLCQTCSPDIVIRPIGGEIRADVYSIWGFVILNLARLNDEVHEQYVKAAKDSEKIGALLGDIRFHSQGFRESIGITGINTNMAFIVNIAFIVVLTLWLALKAHRKVLDYFARNGALLPMVAATGQHAFYTAIWILTCVRVCAFLLASAPLVCFGLFSLFGGDNHNVFDVTHFELVLWLIALILSLSLATLVASIADLKHRHHLLSFTYRYVPVAICLLGSIVWGITFLFEGRLIGYLRNITAAIPVFGVTPILVSPVFKLDFDVLTTHAILTAVLLVLALKYNARWFAAHLEEL